MVTSINLVELLSELVDETALDKPLNWEGLDYEAMKNVAITHTLELFKGVPVNQETIQLMAMMAYLFIENTQLWVENMSHKRRRGPQRGH